MSACGVYRQRRPQTCSGSPTLMETYLFGENVVEAPLGESSLHRHLAAFKAGTHAVARTGLLALVALTGGFAGAGAVASANTLARFGGARRCCKLIAASLSRTSLRFTFVYLNQVADFLQLALGLGVVGLLAHVAHFASAPGKRLWQSGPSWNRSGSSSQA